MQRANIKGPPTPPLEPSSKHTLFATILHHPSLFLPPYAFVSPPVFSIFVRGAAADTRRREREGEKQGQDRLGRDAKARANVLKPRSFSPGPAFFHSFYAQAEEEGRLVDHGRRTRDIITFNYRFSLSRRLRDSRL